MSTKSLFLLLISLPTIHIWSCHLSTSMISGQPELHIPISTTNIKTRMYLDSILSQTLDEIQYSFSFLKNSTRSKVLNSCGDAKPIILMSHSLQEIRTNIASYILNSNDEEAINLFCTLPVDQSLNRYIHSVKYYEQCPLYLADGKRASLAFYYKLSNEECALVYKAAGAVLKREFLTKEDIQKLNGLQSRNSDIMELLRNTSFYTHIPVQEKCKVLIASTTRSLNESDACFVFTILFDLSFMGLFMFENFKKRQSTLQHYSPASIKDALKVAIIGFLGYSGFNIKNRYRNQINFLYEQRRHRF